MKKFLLLIVAAALIAPLSAQAMGTKPTEEAAASQPAKAKGVWIDVRTPEEFSQGHLRNAVNIPANEITTKIKQVSPDKNAPINLYCRSGRRAEAALEALKKEGYTNVTNHGGYEDLLKKGLK
ncbi:rhodanese-like domain-containing protein [Neisseria brasiliensis]|uniref:rhodanese-like domain-containing protein n=1 Tax=Neisseria TaxID=482 RepID=UPI000C278641|nr:rhodanese-like domain-containing protein [Neisseria sp. N177_16]QGL26114.1 rhodanese-like domain-containing protein [Neisseria brasiliensis]